MRKARKPKAISWSTRLDRKKEKKEQKRGKDKNK